jgi:hypothetical protein
VDAAGIYVTDKSNSRIVRISDLTGAGWTTLGSLGERRGQFNLPWGDLCSVTAQKNFLSRALRSAVAFRAICDSTFASLSGPGLHHGCRLGWTLRSVSEVPTANPRSL